MYVCLVMLSYQHFSFTHDVNTIIQVTKIKIIDCLERGRYHMYIKCHINYYIKFSFLIRNIGNTCY